MFSNSNSFSQGQNLCITPLLLVSIHKCRSTWPYLQDVTDRITPSPATTPFLSPASSVQQEVLFERQGQAAVQVTSAQLSTDSILEHALLYRAASKEIGSGVVVAWCLCMSVLLHVRYVLLI